LVTEISLTFGLFLDSAELGNRAADAANSAAAIKTIDLRMGLSTHHLA
jgi:hypothetical protein